MADGDVRVLGVDPTALLTEAEHEFVSLMAQAWSLLCSDIVAQGSSREADLTEAVVHVHALQNMVLSQAAARAMPNLYRGLGEALSRR